MFQKHFHIFPEPSIVNCFYNNSTLLSLLLSFVEEMKLRQITDSVDNSSQMTKFKVVQLVHAWTSKKNLSFHFIKKKSIRSFFNMLGNHCITNAFLFLADNLTLSGSSLKYNSNLHILMHCRNFYFTKTKKSLYLYFL